jgi:hypothetical protein
MRKIYFLLLFAVFCSLFTGANAAFQDIGAGARPIGMGGAFVGIADDANAPLYNPAGIGYITRTQATFMYVALMLGLKEDNLGYGFLSWVNPLSEKNVIGVSLTDFNSALYSEYSLGFSYSRKFSQNLSLGGNIKSLNKIYSVNGYTEINPMFTGKQLTGGLGFDAGLLYKVSDKYTAGIAAENFNQPDIHLATEDIVPMNLKAGIGIKLGSKKTLALDYTASQNIAKDTKLCAGMESWLSNSLALRFGLGTGNNNYSNLSLGMSYVSGKIQVDYAFQSSLTNQVAETYGNHRISVSARFGKDINEQITEKFSFDIKAMKEIPSSVYNLFKDKGISVINLKTTNNSKKEARLRVAYKIGSNPEETKELDIPGKETKTVDLIPILPEKAIRGLLGFSSDNIFIEISEIDRKGRSEQVFKDSYPVLLFAFDQFVPEITDANNVSHNMMDSLVAWVTYNDRNLEKIIVKAGEKGLGMEPKVKIVGFQPPNIFTRAAYLDNRSLREKDADYLSQIRLIYDVLKEDYGINYINQPVAYKNSQRIRFPSDVLANKGNCVELSTLFASLLESIELDPIIVLFLEEGHAVVGWRVAAPEGTAYHVLETNVFGEDFNRVCEKSNELIDKYSLGAELSQTIPFDDSGIYKKGNDIVILDVKRIRSRIPPSSYTSNQ